MFVWSCICMLDYKKCTYMYAYMCVQCFVEEEKNNFHLINDLKYSFLVYIIMFSLVEFKFELWFTFEFPSIISTGCAGTYADRPFKPNHSGVKYPLLWLNSLEISFDSVSEIFESLWAVMKVEKREKKTHTKCCRVLKV